MTGLNASIIILTKNGGANFPRLLERIYNQQFDGAYEVIVIDSGSTDGTLEVARKYPARLHQISPDEFHHSRTRNLGAGMSQGKFVVYITQDALPLDNNWLQKLIDDFSTLQVAMVVGRQVPWENTKPPEKFFYHYNFPAFKIVVQSGSAGYYHDNVFISDVNSAYRKEILLKYQFAENMVMAEDKEIAARFIEAGLTINYEPAAAVYHSHDYGLKELFDKHLDFGLAIRQGASKLPKTADKPGSGMAGYLGAEYKFLRTNHYGKWLLYALVYETARYAGLFMGKNGLMQGSTARRIRQGHD
ncbi:MAG: glycosyltransferase [Chloroflexi bacterium]|nr:glycosyltransferase [Chloroflexota bacterium]